MPRDPDTGMYSLPSPSDLAVPGTKISSDNWNAVVNDWATEITNTLDPRGETPMAASLDMGGQNITNVANGSAGTDLVNVGQLAGLAGYPVGAMIPWPSKATRPSNWLLCTNPTAYVSRRTYATLFSLLGTSYGSKSGQFGLPQATTNEPSGVCVIIKAA